MKALLRALFLLAILGIFSFASLGTALGAEYLNLVGQIKSIDHGAKSFVLTVKDKGDVTISTNADTKFQVPDDKNGKLDHLEAGDRVAVTTVVTADGNLALAVRLLPVIIAGRIKSIDSADRGFVLIVKDRGDVTIKTNADTKVKLYDNRAGTLNDLEAGDRVTVTLWETRDGNLALVVRLLPSYLSGQIKSVDSGTNSFVLAVKDKGDIAIKTNTETKIVLHGDNVGTLDDLKAGDRVTVAMVETADGNLALVVRLLPTYVSGQIKSIDSAASSFVLAVKDKGDIAIKTNTETKIVLHGDNVGTLDDLKAGDRVTVAMVETADGNLALVVRLLPTYVSGQIKSIDQGDKSFVLTVKDRGDVTIGTNAGTKIVLYGDRVGTLNDIEAGDRVTVTMVKTASGNLALVVRLLPTYISGQIKSIDQGDKSFALTVKDKGDVTIGTNAGTKIVLYGDRVGTLVDLEVGDRVTVTMAETAAGNLALVVRLLPTYVSGQIKSIDSGDKSFVLTVKDRGDVIIETNADTKIRFYDNTDGTLNDLEVGGRVTVALWETKGDNLALVVRLLPVSHAGQIKGIDQGDKSFVLTVKDRGDVTIRTNADTRIVLYGDRAGTLNDLEAGDRVTVTMVKTSGGNLALVVRLLPTYVSGQIKSMDSAASRFVLTVKDWGDVTINTNAGTRILLYGGTAGTLGDLEAGDKVTVTMVETADGNLALVVRLLPAYITGQIKSIDLGAKSFVLTVKDKGDVTIVTNADTRVKLYGNTDGTLDDLVAGDQVAVTMVETADGNLALVVRLL